jgi:large subunit ribosomal protein L31
MKKEIHPNNYRPVLFIDNSNGAEFVISSTVNTADKGKAKDGKEYPVYRLEVSSASHPFYTGNEKSLDTAGRAEKFKAKVAKAKATKKSTK